MSPFQLYGILWKIDVFLANMMNAEAGREYFKEFVLTVMHLNCPIIVDKFLLPTKKKNQFLKVWFT